MDAYENFLDCLRLVNNVENDENLEGQDDRVSVVEAIKFLSYEKNKFSENSAQKNFSLAQIFSSAPENDVSAPVACNECTKFVRANFEKNDPVWTEMEKCEKSMNFEQFRILAMQKRALIRARFRSVIQRVTACLPKNDKRISNFDPFDKHFQPIRNPNTIFLMKSLKKYQRKQKVLKLFRHAASMVIMNSYARNSDPWGYLMCVMDKKRQINKEKSRNEDPFEELFKAFTKNLQLSMLQDYENENCRIPVYRKDYDFDKFVGFYQGEKNQISVVAENDAILNFRKNTMDIVSAYEKRMAHEDPYEKQFFQCVSESRNLQNVLEESKNVCVRKNVKKIHDIEAENFEKFFDFFHVKMREKEKHETKNGGEVKNPFAQWRKNTLDILKEYKNFEIPMPQKTASKNASASLTKKRIKLMNLTPLPAESVRRIRNVGSPEPNVVLQQNPVRSTSNATEHSSDNAYAAFHLHLPPLKRPSSLSNLATAAGPMDISANAEKKGHNAKVADSVKFTPLLLDNMLARLCKPLDKRVHSRVVKELLKHERAQHAKTRIRPLREVQQIVDRLNNIPEWRKEMQPYRDPFDLSAILRHDSAPVVSTSHGTRSRSRQKKYQTEENGSKTLQSVRRSIQWASFHQPSQHKVSNDAAKQHQELCTSKSLHLSTPVLHTVSRARSMSPTPLSPGDIKKATAHIPYFFPHEAMAFM